MSDDPFRTWDGPYVLGALTGDDRVTYERHLRTCTACAESVAELAGIPGLLSRVPAPDDDEVEPLPDLLPGLLFAARRERRRRRWVTASGWVAAAACAVTLLLVWLLPSTPANAVVLAPMETIGDTGISGEAGVDPVTWGTRIKVRCSYPAGEAPGERYDLQVVARSGITETVGSWKVVPGRTTTMDASTAIAGEDIAGVRVVEGTAVVLQLDR